MKSQNGKINSILKKTEKKEKYDVLLINPPVFHPIKNDEQSELIEDYWTSLDKLGKQLGDREDEPNIGLLYIASVLEREGHQVQLIDFHFMDLEERRKNGSISLQRIKEEISKHSFHCVGISCFTVNYRVTMEIARFIKTNFNCFIFLGGNYPTMASEEILFEEKSIDAIVRGEGEITVVEMLENLDDLSSVRGLSYRKAGGGVTENPERELIQNLDDIPYPEWSLLPHHSENIIYRVITSRGCPYKCSFCFPKTFWREQVRYRDPKEVVDQIEYLIKRYGVKDLLIGDLTFFENFEHGKGVCEEIINRDLKISWWCQTRASCISKDVVNLLKKAGCKQVSIGIESIEKSRKIINKVMSNNEILNALILLKKEGITTQGYFIIGLPDEEIKDVISNIDFMEQLIEDGLLDLTCIGILVPFFGLDLCNQRDKIEILDKDTNNYFMCVTKYCNPYPVYRTKHLSRYQIRALWELAMATASKVHRIVYEKK